jgi:chitin synthase
MGPAVSNMFLAEDRILCVEILARRGRRWLLSFVSDAAADTDAPTTLVQLIKQRRRWINGAFYAQIYSLSSFGRLLSASHGPLQKLVFTTQYFFNIISLGL